MNAKEMFEKLGFKLKNAKGIEGVRYIKVYKSVRVSIIFHTHSKIYKLYGDCYNSLTNVEIELHQAITQQMKELGWIE